MSKFGAAFDKEQYRAFKEAWLLKCHIELDIQKLANMNCSLAYAAVKTGEKVIDYIFAKHLEMVNQKKEALQKESGE